MKEANTLIWHVGTGVHEIQFSQPEHIKITAPTPGWWPPGRDHIATAQ